VVPLKQLRAKWEKGRIRQAIILQYNCLLDQGKNPVQAADHPLLATEIALCEVCREFALPVHAAHDVAHLLAGFRFTWLVWPWPIRYKQQSRRPNLGNCLEHSAGGMWPIEDEHRHRCFKSLCFYQVLTFLNCGDRRTKSAPDKSFVTIISLY
jgi:hypothetical protein